MGGSNERLVPYHATCAHVLVAAGATALVDYAGLRAVAAMRWTLVSAPPRLSGFTTWQGRLPRRGIGGDPS